MIIDEKKVVLKNGKECVFRSPSGGDAGEIINHLKVTSLETIYMSRFAEEIVTTLEEEAICIENENASNKTLTICAVVDDMIIGQGGIAVYRNNRKFLHRAKIGLSIQKEFWGLSIGYHLMNLLIENASKIEIEQIELTVATDNERAINLYKKIGFEIVGTISNSMKISDEQYIDEFYMIYKIK